MFDNLLFQGAAEMLAADIRNSSLPGALLFAGPEFSGKLTAALETARILSCRNEPRGEWECQCPSCRRHRSLVARNLLLLGAKDCMTEIRASRSVFLNALEADFRVPAHFLFVRSVRKLLMRFDPVLWEDDDKFPKFAPLLSDIGELLEELDVGRNLGEASKVEKKSGELEKLCAKLDDGFMYSALPVSQVRSASEWARMTTTEEKKILIIEGADKIQEGARNAMLKILEEPPADTVFVLTARNRGSVMQTILSRSRTYLFAERAAHQQAQVLSRVFHADTGGNSSVRGFLRRFLPVPEAEIFSAADEFFSALLNFRLPQADALSSRCGGFKPRQIFVLFLERLSFLNARLASRDSRSASAAAQISVLLRKSLSSVGSYNQNPASALEEFSRGALLVLKCHE